MASTIALGNAKASLSAVIRDVSTTGREYVVTVRNKPLAMIVPMPQPAPTTPKAMGMLAGKRPVASRKAEKDAYAKALEEKYGDSNLA